MGFWHGKASNCYWFYHHGENGDWRAFVEATRRAFESCARGDVLLNLPYRFVAPNARERRELADCIKSSPAAGKIAYHAFATDSRLIYGINQAISWLAQKPWQEDAFLRPDAAFAWLRSVSPAFDAEQTRLAICNAVPAEALWPPFFTAHPAQLRRA